MTRPICWACLLGWNVPVWLIVSFICWATYETLGAASVLFVIVGAALTRVPRWPHG